MQTRPLPKMSTPCCSAPACSKRQRMLAAAGTTQPSATAAASAARQRQQSAASRQRRQPPAARCSHRRGVRASAAAGDLGDEFEEMVERRDELLRIREDADLDTDEDEELAALTEREWVGQGLQCPLSFACLTSASMLEKLHPHEPAWLPTDGCLREELRGCTMVLPLSAAALRACCGQPQAADRVHRWPHLQASSSLATWRTLRRMGWRMRWTTTTRATMRRRPRRCLTKTKT